MAMRISMARTQWKKKASSWLAHQTNVEDNLRSRWGETLNGINTSLTNVLNTSLTVGLGRGVEASEASWNAAAQAHGQPARAWVAIRMLPRSFSCNSPTSTGPK
jgi:hypothetical protein